MRYGGEWGGGCGGGQRPALMWWGWGRSRDNEAGSLLGWLPPSPLVMGAQLLFLTVLKPLGRERWL